MRTGLVVLLVLAARPAAAQLSSSPEQTLVCYPNKTSTLQIRESPKSLVRIDIKAMGACVVSFALSDLLRKDDPATVTFDVYPGPPKVPSNELGEMAPNGPSKAKKAVLLGDGTIEFYPNTHLNFPDKSALTEEHVYTVTLTVVGVVVDPRLRSVFQWLVDRDAAAALIPTMLCELTSADLPWRAPCQADLGEALAVSVARAKVGSGRNLEFERYVGKSDHYQQLKAEAAALHASTPSVVFHLTRTLPGDEFDSSLKAFDEASEVDFFTQLLSKVAAALDKPLNDVVIVADYDWECDQRLVFMAGGKAYSHEVQCAGESAQARIAQFRPDLRSSASSIQLQTGVLPAIVDGLLLEQFQNTGAKWRFLGRDPQIVEVDVGNIRGVAIPHGRLWERLRLNFFLTSGHGGAVLRLIGEGFVAPGLIGPPTDTQFTESMDTHYAAQLSDFVKCLVVRSAAIASVGPDKKRGCS